MTHSTERLAVLCFGLGIVFALGLLVAHQHMVPQAYAQDTGVAGGGWQGIGTQVWKKKGNGCLWIFDADNRQLACYQCKTGRSINLVGVRKVTWDLELLSARDQSELTPQEMKDLWEKSQKKD